jgi:hypothetical protein
MSMLFDDIASGGQVMVGAGQPVSLGVGAEEKIRGSMFVEAPMQVGKAGAYRERQATLMVGRTENVDCDSPDRSLFVKGNVSVEGDDGTDNAVRIKKGSGINALYVDGDVFVTGKVDCGNKGKLAARFRQADARPKKFDMEHPSKGKGHRLAHACIEGPEVGVYFRGRLTNRTEIEMPLYWKDLVHTNSISVQLQPIGAHQDIIVKRVDEKKIYLQAKGGMPIDCYYHVYAERKDCNPLIVEYEGETYEDYPDKDSKDPQYSNRNNNTITR